MNKLLFTLLLGILLSTQAGCDFDILLDEFDRVGYVSDYGGGDWYVTETVYYDEPAYYVEESYAEEVWVEDDWYYDEEYYEEDWYEEEWYDEEYYEEEWYQDEWDNEEWYEDEPYFWWWP